MASPRIDIGCRGPIGASTNTRVSFPTHLAYVHIPVHITEATTKLTGLVTRLGLVLCK